MISEEFLKSVPNSHRKKFGQVYTNPEIAKFMLKWILQKNIDSLHDPAFGMGIFYKIAKELNFSGNFSALEVDKLSYEFYKNNKKVDFLKNENYFMEWDKKYDAIICNPPYLKFNVFPDKSKLIQDFFKFTGVKLSGYINSASAFLLKSVFELNYGGRAAYILPLEFLNTNYGIEVKKFLLQSGSIRNIIKINDESNVFSSVVTTVCIIFFEKIIDDNNIVFSEIDDIYDIDVNELNKVSPKHINPKEKWLPYFGKNQKKIYHKEDTFVSLSSYGFFKRGIATGANEFFSLNLEKINELKLKKHEYSLCITKSNQIKSSFLKEEDIDYLESLNEKIFLFNVKKEKAISNGAKNYIFFGEKEGYQNRFLTKNRPYWFKLECRNPSPILFGVFSRNKFKIIRNYTSAVSLTCYHGFIPNIEKQQYIDRIFLYLKSDLGQDFLIKSRRKYGNNLDKFEPSDLNTILVPSPEVLDHLDENMVYDELKYIERYDKPSSYFNSFLESLLK